MEEILFKPDPCAFRYLQTVANKFRACAQILFGPQDLADSFIFSFENEYKVEIDLVNPFGGVVKYHPDGTKSIGEPAQYSNTAQAYLNFPVSSGKSTKKTFTTLSKFSPRWTILRCHTHNAIERWSYSLLKTVLKESAPIIN